MLDIPKYNKKNASRAYYHKVARQLKIYKESLPCKDCGEYYKACQMDFDHLFDKNKNVSLLVGKCSWEKLSLELVKCELVCANCHRLRTSARLAPLLSVIPLKNDRRKDIIIPCPKGHTDWYVLGRRRYCRPCRNERQRKRRGKSVV